MNKWWLPPAKDPKHEAFEAHLRALGFSKAEPYQEWCAANGLSTDWDKTPSKRFEEIKLIKEQRIVQAFQEGRLRNQPLYKKIRAYIQNPEALQKDPNIQSFALSAKKFNFPLEDFLSFIEVIDKKTELLATKELSEALLLVFRERSRWIRRPQEFNCKTKNLHGQFNQLLRHLFSRYKIPEFMDQAWLMSLERDREEYIPWFLWVAEGKNLRTYPKMPIAVNKGIIHEFLKAPSNYSIPQALRYGQLKFLNASGRLINGVLESQIGREFKNEEFWLSFLQFICRQQFFDPVLIPNLVDYLQHQKFSPNAPQPLLSMKGRRLEILINESEAWHARIQKERGKHYLEWNPQDVDVFKKEEKSGENLNLWTMEELTNSKQLEAEGSTMKHCVASYKYSCHQKRKSIWSLKLNGLRVATIEVDLAQKAIVQAKGKYNAKVEGKAMTLLMEWAGHARYDIKLGLW